jgi:hypothetical protein
MANIRFVSSANVSFDLHSFEYAKLQKANFHKVNWIPEVEKKQFGVKVNRFTKDAQIFDCTFRFKGDAAKRKKQIDDFIFQTEQDCSRLQLGRIYWNTQYIDVYFNSHDTHPVDSGMNWTEIQGQFYAPFPFWIDEQTLIIRPSGQSEEGFPENVKGYPEDRNFVYGYDYAYPYASTAVVIDVDTPISSDFKVIAYGPTDKVQFFIAGHKYQVNYELRNGQYMVIDSRDTTPMNRRAYVRNENGTITNVFDYRDPTSLLFEKIPNGSVVLNYPRTYGIDLTIFQERSAPR